MAEPRIMQPSQGSRIYQDASATILFGQPPEVLKGLLINKISKFDTLVLTDIREKDGSLTNNLEFPLYFFLFFANGLTQSRRLNLVGEQTDISHALRLLRFTLMGPSKTELIGWRTDAEIRDEWLTVANALTLTDDAGQAIPVEDFFNILPFENGQAQVGNLTITHLAPDVYEVSNTTHKSVIDLNADTEIGPPYQVEPDYVPGGLVKMGLEILGGASGFTPTEPCTGLALCYNGDYLLIDAIPFLDQHLYARGISKNQVSAVFLTHLHDDHCSMFPLMLMPHRVDVITTREIFAMAMEKLACGIGWTVDTVQEHFKLVEVRPGKKYNYYGLTIEPHLTVHSIPTIGATFSMMDKGVSRQMCIIGDNHSMTTIRMMGKRGLVRASTIETLERLYTKRFSLLVADGGAGAIHGDPADAIKSESERVIFVHVDDLPNEFNTTFSLARSGKRYTVTEGDPAIYASQINHYLTTWLGEPFPNRWMRSLLAEKEVRRYNTDDVIIVQDAATQGFVYLILTGYCEVVRHDGEQLLTVAKLQAGDVIGEMAVITGSGIRNASVVARTPVTICLFAEETFRSFIVAEGFKDKLLLRWSLRPAIKRLAPFSQLTSTVIEQVGRITAWELLEAGTSVDVDEQTWCMLTDGTATWDGEEMVQGDEYGGRPFAPPRPGRVYSRDGCALIMIKLDKLRALRMEVPQLNYYLRKLRSTEANNDVEWALGTVKTAA